MLMIQYEMAFSLSYIFNYHSLTSASHYQFLIKSLRSSRYFFFFSSALLSPPRADHQTQLTSRNWLFFKYFFYCDCIIRLEFMSHIIIYRLISSWIMYQKQSRGGEKKKKILIVWFKNLHRESLLTIQIFSFVKSSLIGACVFQQSKQKCNVWVRKVSHH